MIRSINNCAITAVERPKRKLIYRPSHNAEDYFSYCGEVGCDWEAILNNIPEKFDTAAIVELPDFLVGEGYSKIAAGIEVPADYDGVVPKLYKVAELGESTMLCFRSEPYENEEDFCIAIESAFEAISEYDPASDGYRFAYDKAPSFNFGANAKEGAKLAVPVEKL